MTSGNNHLLHRFKYAMERMLRLRGITRLVLIQDVDDLEPGDRKGLKALGADFLVTFFEQRKHRGQNEICKVYVKLFTGYENIKLFKTHPEFELHNRLLLIINPWMNSQDIANKFWLELFWQRKSLYQMLNKNSLSGKMNFTIPNYKGQPLKDADYLRAKKTTYSRKLLHIN